jgi:hypothetical protein
VEGNRAHQSVLLPVGCDVEGQGLLLVSERDLSGGRHGDSGLRGDGHGNAVGADGNAPRGRKSAGGGEREADVVDVRALHHTARSVSASFIHRQTNAQEGRVPYL